jgi:acylpyruvate hydrolase
MTGRNVQDAAKEKGLPWTAAKGFDTFTPIRQAQSSSIANVPGQRFHSQDRYI